jgi:predicted ATPase
VATYIIERNKANNGALPWTDRDSFQKQVLAKQQEWEKEIPEGIEKVFLDRGVADGLAYYKMDNLEPPAELVEAARKANYTKVLVLEPLKSYEQTTTRREDAETAKKLHELITQTYRELGYETISIGPGTPEERARKILENC